MNNVASLNSTRAMIANAITGPTINPKQFAPAPKEPTSTPHEAHKAGKVLAGITTAVVATVGLLIAGNKTGVLKNIGKYIPNSIKDAGFLKNIKEPAKKLVGKLDTAGEYLFNKGEGIFNAIKNSSVVEKIKNFKPSEFFNKFSKKA